MHLSFATATDADVPAMAACRLTDPAAGPADPRMAAYFRGEHHPGGALPPRVGFIAKTNGSVIGYGAGHLSTRHGCEGELQFLFVAPLHRRKGIGIALVQLLAAWFQEHNAHRVCVSIDRDSPSAQPFYQRLGAMPLSPLKKYWYVWREIGVLIRTVKPPDVR